MRKTRSRCSCGFDFSSEANRHRRVCGDCGAKRIPKTRPKHNRALELGREVFVEANGGYDGCWVCRELGVELAGPTYRDHEHKGEGKPRGILCGYHNRCLGPRYTPQLTAALARYLNREEAA